VHISEDLPVNIANTGNQLVPDYHIHAVVTWWF
jgi:diadenosine tetraphosphate (Ap4A) HIT family hydrolase